MTKTRFEAIKQRVARATPGPWRFKGERLDKMLIGGTEGELVHGVTAPIIVGDPCVVNPQDEPFIAHSRIDIEVLLAVVNELRFALDHRWNWPEWEDRAQKVLDALDAEDTDD